MFATAFTSAYLIALINLRFIPEAFDDDRYHRVPHKIGMNSVTLSIRLAVLGVCLSIHMLNE